MFIILTLVTMLIILIAFVIIGAATAGASFIIVFGDVFVAAMIVIWITYILIKRRKE